MNKVFIVSKTHLDLGFTDFAANIERRYIEEFIPKAIAICKAVNTEGKKFVWTLGSWLIEKALQKGSEKSIGELNAALERGDIVPHAMPFTTHTELLDEETLRFGLSFVKRLDARFNRTTIAAKVTDVPGHTIGLIKFLAENGIKLLHIGVNGASALPDVPPVFLWKEGKNEVVVIYTGGYGGEHKNEFTNDILYLDHTLDNNGPASEEKVLKNFDAVKARYPGYEVMAGTLNDYAASIWAVKDKLPVVTEEIGDSWIHGAATDPYKIAGAKTLMRLRNKWLANGSLKREDAEYYGISDNILCICEHTWGLDVKNFFGDYENYLRKDFDAARKADQVKVKHIFRHSLTHAFFDRILKRIKGKYSVMEKGWKEQRAYLDKAMSAMTAAHKEEAARELALLIPSVKMPSLKERMIYGKKIKCGKFVASFNEYGGLETLEYDNDAIIKSNDKPAVEYVSYGKDDYDFWLTHYTRDYKKNFFWSKADFARPDIEYIDKKYPHGRFAYKSAKASFTQGKDKLEALFELQSDAVAFTELGAPKTIQIKYTFSAKSVRVELIWLDKPANRLTEATFFRLYPSVFNKSLVLSKLGTEVSPDKIVRNGNRHISGVDHADYISSAHGVRLTSWQAPLLSLGEGKILRYDNVVEDYDENGVSYILHDNVWGTNFPLWYNDNAYFAFDISVK